ncbi:LOW QUALITY PROTEIN: macrophage mannose receptor 1 [Drosophila gunungcola]|uniref:LOW QUALITY PROTEIN: macrophage mannose receptor 1 n=1 Tax=Drosophila gunungcola TaxID=103775 RepID=UPI0022E55B5C|nr:LOW QUALITY PROTEIN: macrophage mannose receptor 1 [Drosophila gunungcola]
MRSLFLISFLFGLAWAQPELQLSPTSPAPDNETAEEAEQFEVPVFSPFSLRDGRFAFGGFAKVNWFQAQATCAAYGYTLVSITSEQDQRSLRNFLFTFARSQQELLADPLWTSGTDLASNNNWVWFSKGRSINYRNFQNGLPGDQSGDSNCLGINGMNGLWINEHCSEQRYFICEKRCQFDDDVY